MESWPSSGGVIVMENIAECPGCGLKLNNQQLTLMGNYNASGECYQKFSESSVYTIGQQDIDFIHQHAIDAYSAQHSGNSMKPITTAFSSVGLYYAIEKRFNGRQVQRVHTLLSRHKYNWAKLHPPDNSVYSITVLDVLNQLPGDPRMYVRCVGMLGQSA